MKAGHWGGVVLWPSRSWRNVQKNWAGAPRDVYGGSVSKPHGQTRNLTDSFPFLSPPLEPPAAPNPAGIQIPLLIYAAMLHFVATQELLLLLFLPTCDTLVFTLKAPWNSKHRKFTVKRNVHFNADTSTPPSRTLIPSDLWGCWSSSLSSSAPSSAIFMESLWMSADIIAFLDCWF